jgi:thiol-disulfide isomerase/thioredoxin
VCRTTLSLLLRTVSLIVVFSATWIACGSPPDEAAQQAGQARAELDPVEILEASATALRAVETARYDFTYGGPEDPTGWLTGQVLMRQQADAAKSWIRVEGVVHAQPAFGVEERSFAFATDGETAWAVEGAGDLERAPVGSGANRLSATAVYGWLPELVEAEPLWRELTRHQELRLLETVVIDGETCDTIQVKIATESGPASEVRWSIARRDRLPRRGQWFTPFSGPDDMTLTLENLETGIELHRADFAPPSDPEPIERLVAVGDRAPAWELRTPEGGMVRLADLNGQVVVLDFWNTWCPLCRSIGPDTRALARETRGERVRFFGVNVFETADPVAYWKEIGEPYPLLLEGEELAGKLDLPWQPGIVVIGPRGTVLYKQLGASADRIERVRAAIAEGLAVGWVGSTN